MTFNPFDKGFKDVGESDLDILRSVSEGWHIEYKRGNQNGKQIAKSISSFANSYGGIYFLGVDANEENFAENFPGVDDSPDRIRDSISNNLQPFPYFDTYSISLNPNSASF